MNENRWQVRISPILATVGEPTDIAHAVRDAQEVQDLIGTDHDVYLLSTSGQRMSIQDALHLEEFSGCDTIQSNDDAAALLGGDE